MAELTDLNSCMATSQYMARPGAAGAKEEVLPQVT